MVSLGRTPELSTFFKRITQVVSTCIPNKEFKEVFVKAPIYVCTSELKNFDSNKKQNVLNTFRTGKIRICSGPMVTTQIRYARFEYYRDVRVPDFTKSRRDSVACSNAKNSESSDERRLTSYLFTTGAAVASWYTAKVMIHECVLSMAASADVLALSKIEINLSDIPEGVNSTFKWRGKPLFVRHRTPEEIEMAQNVNMSELRDPEDDSERVKRTDWLIVIGICTHLGCVPISHAGDYGGYYCPCHGSHFDTAGRVRKGPAPTNLEIPPYTFVDEESLVVG